jgi:hypothetical protein
MTTRDTTPGVARSLDELLRGVTDRHPLKTGDSKSGARFERVVINDRPHVVKHFDSPDWLADAARDETCRSVGLFEDGFYDTVGDIVDSTVVGAARLGAAGQAWPAALLMRDATADFVPYDAAVSLETHGAFIEAMAALHARFWENPPVLTYMEFACTYEMLSPRRAVRERDECGDRSDVLRAVLPAWDRLATRHPELWRGIRDVLDDPAPLMRALARTPVTFLHGGWKMGNLGRRADGRVVLVDWDRPSVGPGTADLAWYLSVNCDRLPESKEACIERYRHRLETGGVATTSWWQEQLDLALLGAFLQLGWSKTEQPDELAWWTAAAQRGAERL